MNPFNRRFAARHSFGSAVFVICVALLAVVPRIGAEDALSMPAKVKTGADVAKPVPQPKALKLGAAPAKTAGLPAPDLSAVLAEDEATAKNTDAKSPKRIGIKRPLESVIPADSEWQTLADGGRLWVGRFFSSGSFGTRLHFQEVSLPPGVVLIAYDRANPQYVEGPFDDAYLAGRDSFWSSTVFGEDVIVEAHVPAGSPLPAFRISELTHQYAGIGSESGAKNAGDCEIDFACHLAEWGQTGSAVGGIGSVSQNGVLFCTGCLLNDQNPATSTDYFLTAQHCLTSQSAASSVEIYWNYQKPTCNGVEPNPASVPRTRGGADILSSRARGSTAGMNDHCFLQLRGAVPSGITYAGWTVNSPAAGEVITCIHHPDGDFKRISKGTVSAQSTPNFWNILWTPGQGVTEPGSSGSPIFNAAHEVIGQEFGGTSACGLADPSLQNDDYGRLSVTFPLIRAWLLNENPPPPPTAPTNNAFASARVLSTASGSATSDSSRATRETGEPNHAGNSGGASLWFRWTAPASGAATFDTLGSGFDTLLAIYTGVAVNALTLVGQNDDINTEAEQYQSRVAFAATAGVTYFIAVDGYNGEGGTVVLSWSAPGGGGGGNNNNFANAAIVTGAAGQATGFNVGYSREAGEPTHQIPTIPAGNVGQRSAWWSWTATGNGPATFDTIGSSFDTVMAVYTGSTVGALVQVAQNDDIDFDAGISQSRVTFTAVAGTVYRIAVDGYRYTNPSVFQEEGSITLNWSGPGGGGGGGGNDSFAGATTISGATGQATGSNVNYSRETGEPTHQPPSVPAANIGQRSGWWTWTAPAGGQVVFDTVGSSFDTVLAVYTGSAVGALNQVAQNDDLSGSTSVSRVTFTAVAGTVYRIAVDGYRSSGGAQREGNIVLNWALDSVQPGGKPDLAVWEPSLEPRLEFRTFAAGDCAVLEGCVVSGRRKLITFNTEVRNLGDADVRLGVPGPGNTNFVWDPCHGHYHWTNYASYRLVDSNGVVTVGRKIGFCLLDSIHWNTTNGPAESRYDCTDQGISVGWGDVYGRNLSCQWIDVTDVPDGSYTLEIEVDPSNQFDELNESNNIVRVPFTVAPIVQPANDDFANARTLHGPAGVVTGNNVGATIEAGETPAGGNQTVWFRWEAPCSGTAVFDTANTGFDTVLAAYSGTAVNALTVIAQNDDEGAGTTSRITFPATQGTTYRIAVNGYGDNVGLYRLNWTLTGGACPAPTRPIPIERPTANGPFSVGFFGQQGETYALDVTDSLENPNWVRLLTTTGLGQMMQFTDNGAGGHAFRYYKIVQIIP